MRSYGVFLSLSCLTCCSGPPCPAQPPPWYTQGYEAPRFGESVRQDVVSQTRTARLATYAELRTNGRVVGRAGWRCASASAPEECEQAYSRLVWPTQGPALLAEPSPGQFLLLQGAQRIGEWLGPVDGLAAAALRAVVAGYEVHDDATGEVEGDHWLLLVFGQPPERRPQVIRVYRDGTITRP